MGIVAPRTTKDMGFQNRSMKLARRVDLFGQLRSLILLKLLSTKVFCTSKMLTDKLKAFSIVNFANFKLWSFLNFQFYKWLKTININIYSFTRLEWSKWDYWNC